SPSGFIIYSTYLSGTSATASAIATDGAGNAYVAGYTSSSTFPVTSGAYQKTLGGFQDAFVLVLNPAGSGLIYSTYFGGSSTDSAVGIAVDSSGRAVIAGNTFGSVPVTPGVVQPTSGGAQDAFIAKFDVAGSLVFSTYLGGN